MNQIVIIGRLTRDVDLRETQDGMSYARFTLAVDRNLSKDKKREFESRGVATADFIPVVVWGAQARTCANYLSKGKLVAVSGSIRTSSYEKDGQRRYSTDVNAQNVQFLEWGDKSFRRDEQDETDSFGDISGFEPTDSDIPF